MTDEKKKYRLSVHFSDLDDASAKKVAHAISEVIGMDVYLVRDSTVRKGVMFKPIERGDGSGKTTWTKYL
jgi:hypothetical protein